MKVLDTFALQIREEYDITLSFDLVYSCERDTAKQDFIAKEACPKMLFADIKDMQSGRAQDMLTRKMARIPFVAVLIAGFPCVDRSSQNSKASSNKGCVAKAAGATGLGFEHIRQYTEANSVPMIILENVTKLGEIDIDTKQSDVDHIVKAMRKKGYAAFVDRVHAEDYGSPAFRARFHFTNSSVQGKPVLDRLRFGNVLTCMKLARDDGEGVFEIGDFIEQDADKALATQSKLAFPPLATKGSEAARIKGDPGFKQEHLQAFKLSGLQWPPQFEDGAQAYETLGQRPAEVVHFCNAVWPYSEEGVEFMDANESLSRLTNFKLHESTTPEDLKNPWRRMVPTITGHSVMVCRIARSDGTLDLREVAGFELMRLIGWDDCHLKNGVDRSEMNIALMRSLAGNAFSAFAVGPILAASFACHGSGALQLQLFGSDSDATAMDSDSDAP